MKTLIIALSLLGCFYGLNAKELSGTEIAQLAYDLDKGITSIFQSEMDLVSKGKKKERKFIMINTDDKKNDINKTVISFTYPNDIKETSLLSINNKDDDTVQWLYLPTLKNTRRITSSGKGRRFAGSDLFYEDFERRKVNKDRHTRLPDNSFNGKPCYVIESTPIDTKSSAYSKRIIWIDKSNYVAMKIAFFQKGKIIKEMEVNNVKLIEKIWTVVSFTVTDKTDNHSTVVTMKKVKYNQQINDSYFTNRYLENPSSYKKLAGQ